MAFNVSEFRSKFGLEPQRPNMFEVIVVPPASLLPIAAFTDAINFRFKCQGAQIPGQSVDTFPFAAGGYGPNINIANGTRYEPIRLDVIMGQRGFERQLFKSWIDFIQPLQLFNSTVRYHDSYTGTVIVNTFDSQGHISSITTALNAFPMNLGGVDLHWSHNNSYASFNVEMAFERCSTVSPRSAPGGLADTVPMPDVSTLIESALGFDIPGI